MSSSSHRPRKSCWIHSEVRRRPERCWTPGRLSLCLWRGPRSSGICCNSAGPVRPRPRPWWRLLDIPGVRCHNDLWWPLPSLSLTPLSPSPRPLCPCSQTPRPSLSPWWPPPWRWSPWPGPGSRNWVTSAPTPEPGSSWSPSPAGPQAASGASAPFGNVSSTNLK